MLRAGWTGPHGSRRRWPNRTAARVTGLGPLKPPAPGGRCARAPPPSPTPGGAPCTTTNSNRSRATFISSTTRPIATATGATGARAASRATCSGTRRPMTRSSCARIATGTGRTSRSATIATTAPSSTSSSDVAGPLLGSVREELRSWLGTARPAPMPSRRARRGGPRARAVGRPRCSRRRASSPRATTSARGAFARRPCPTRASPAPGASSARQTCSSRTATKRARSPASRSKTAASRGSRRAAQDRLAERGPRGDRALVVTESAIDALSYHQLHPEQRSRRYLSTAGAPSTTQIELLERFFARLPRASTVVAAVDSDEAGHKTRESHRGTDASVPQVGFQRDAPAGAKDWNDVLQRVERDFIRSLTKGPRDRAGPER